MGTNFYWKKIPQKILDIGGNRVVDETMSIFKHIGKRSASGLYCKQCGITFCKSGTRGVHSSGPDYSLLFNQDKMTPEQIERNKQEFERQKDMFYFKTCPCCGTEFEREKENIMGSCSFNWTMMLHKQIILSLLESDEKVIVDEYDDEYTAKEFMENEFLPYVRIENQDACEFC